MQRSQRIFWGLVAFLNVAAGHASATNACPGGTKFFAWEGRAGCVSPTTKKVFACVRRTKGCPSHLSLEWKEQDSSSGSGYVYHCCPK